MSEQVNLPEDWEPYAVQPSHGFMLWLAVISLVVVTCLNIWWPQLGGVTGPREVHQGCVPMYYNNRPVIVCERSSP